MIIGQDYPRRELKVGRRGLLEFGGPASKPVLAQQGDEDAPPQVLAPNLPVLHLRQDEILVVAGAHGNQKLAAVHQLL